MWMSRRFLPSLLLAAWLAGFSPAYGDTKEIVRYGGPHLWHGDFSHHGFCLVEAPGMPLIAVSTLKERAGEARCQFVLLLRSKERSSSLSGANRTSARWSPSGATIDQSLAYEFDGKQVVIEFKYDGNAENELRSSLAIGGTRITDASTRVFIVDTTGDEVKYTPIPCKLPDTAPALDAERGDAFEQSWRQFIADLKKESRQVQTFLTSRGKPE